MAHTITAVQGTVQSLFKIERAILSVSDKTGLVDLAKFLESRGVELLSTGGTAKAMRDAGVKVMDVSEYTGAPEMMDGRVKTLHPKVHGGILAVRGNEKHEKDMVENGIKKIDLVVLNLYAFEDTVAKGCNFETCIENIDIGGPSMLRSSAKNHAAVVICSSPSQYASLMEEMIENDGCTTIQLRKRFASDAFALSAKYDSAISNWFAHQLNADTPSDAIVTRQYVPEVVLKYGCNPQQKPACLCRHLNQDMPFEILHGTPGYINICDALNAWMLVSEAQKATGIIAAASFKHVSPAGAALAVPLTAVECQAYEVTDPSIAGAALAYLRARNADPMSSFGDFAAISGVVDETAAKFISNCICDGIIAAGYEPAALDILQKKKSGSFIVLQGKVDFVIPEMEYRELHGCVLAQRHNDVIPSKEYMVNFVTEKKAVSEAAMLDMVLGNICIKYTQSNSVGYAINGQMIGVGAGQQSRIDCVKLAARKAALWYLRQHPKVLNLQFKHGVKKQERVNARVRYIEGDFTEVEYNQWKEMFEVIPEPLTQEEKDDFVKTMDGVSLCSDAFFPFRDNIDCASKYGVKYISQPGGSVQDEIVTKAADSYGMAMVHTGLRLFHH